MLVQIKASKAGTVIFNRYSELQVYNIEKMKPTRMNNISSSYAPKLDITERYVIDLPEHLKKCNSDINIKEWKSVNFVDLDQIKLKGDNFFDYLRNSMHQISSNKIQIKSYFINDSQWLAINRIKSSWAQTFVEFYENNMNLQYLVSENKFNNYTLKANLEGIENYQLKGNCDWDYLITCKGINIEDVIALVKDSIIHLDKVIMVDNYYSSLADAPVNIDSVSSLLAQGCEMLSLIN